jgi:hypothetical protein
VLLLLLALSPALAFEEEGLEIIVEEFLDTPAARAELDRAIVDMGYKPGMRVGDQVLHFPENDGWPVVIVHDEGFVTAEARASFGVSPRLAMQFEERLLTAIHPALLAWRRAMAAEALGFRREELLAELETFRMLPVEDQRELVRAVWWNTADTPEGLQVRLWVEDWAQDALGAEFVNGLGVRYEHDGPPPDFSSLMEPEPEAPDAVEVERAKVVLPPPGLSRDILTLELP